jgi:uncharacterized surface protein with fasciclin (FAS1) repeats
VFLLLLVVAAFGAVAEQARAETPGSQAPQGEKWALVTDIDNHQDRGITPLGAAGEDARAIEATLTVRATASIPVPPDTPPVTNPKALFDTIAETDDLKMFGNELDSAGLKDGLSGPGPYTVFVPNNAAFAAFDAARLAELQKPENRAHLSALINSHVIKGKYTIEQLKQEATAAGPAGKKYDTLMGGPVTITYDQENKILTVNGVTIVETDIEASNGIIHVIGQILTPLPAPVPDRPATHLNTRDILVVRVRSAEDGLPINGIGVRTDSETERPRYALTGPDGVARFVLTPGTYTVILNGSAAGYETREGINPATKRPYTLPGHEGTRANVVITAGQPITIDCIPARHIGSAK